MEINDITGQTCFFALMGPKTFQVKNIHCLLDLPLCIPKNLVCSRIDPRRNFVVFVFKVMEALKLHDIVGQPYGTHHHYMVNIYLYPFHLTHPDFQSLYNSDLIFLFFHHYGSSCGCFLLHHSKGV